MTNIYLKALRTVRKEVKRKAGKPCGEIDIDCAVCKLHILLAYLDWEIECQETRWLDKIKIK